jgi:hypothetical protein
MYRKSLIAGLAIIALPTLSVSAFAHDDLVTPDTALETSSSATQSTITPSAASQTAITSDLSAPDVALLLPKDVSTPPETTLADGDLIELRGGQAIVVGNQTLTAISNGNAFNGNYVAGSIALTDNALSNFNGLGNLVINTGAQNNLQSAMNVTINFAQ